MAESALKLENVKKTYGKLVKTEVLHGLNFTIDKGSFTAIIGQSGSGKSTLLNIIGTLDKPTEGTVKILGTRTDTMDKNALALLRNKTIGFVFQHHYLLPEFTAMENILMPHRITHGKIDVETKAYAEELIGLMSLDKVKNNPANEMSGGQQQRVAIARALINRPEIILADEPTGSLDSETTDNIYALLREVNQRYGTTFVVITHDQEVAQKADRIIELKDGNITLDVVPKTKED